MTDITFQCPRCKGKGEIVMKPGLGPLLRYLRESRDESLSQVATVTGLTKAHIHALETGRSANPSLAMARKFSQHFDISLDDLVRAMEASND